MKKKLKKNKAFNGQYSYNDKNDVTQGQSEFSIISFNLSARLKNYFGKGLTFYKNGRNHGILMRIEIDNQKIT